MLPVADAAAVFEQTDADGDGTISRAEFRAATHGLHQGATDRGFRGLT